MHIINTQVFYNFVDLRNSLHSLLSASACTNLCLGHVWLSLLHQSKWCVGRWHRNIVQLPVVIATPEEGHSESLLTVMASAWQPVVPRPHRSVTHQHQHRHQGPA